jgi:AraC-like DNA-binding protein
MSGGWGRVMNTLENTQKTAALLLPRPALAGCVVLAIVRDTRHRNLTRAQRFNHFATSPYVALTWHFQGTNRLIATEAQQGHPEDARPFPRFMLSGPSSGPVTTWSDGPIFALTVGFYPDAFEELSGVPAALLFDRTEPAEDHLPKDVLTRLMPVFDGGSAEERFARFEDRVTPLWSERRSRDSVAPFWLSDWTRSLAMRAASSASGRSLRQMQRRVKGWTGRSQRELELLARNEELFARVMSREEGTRPAYADIAAEMGYADQSHMSREVRRMTGASPGKILELIETEESYWLYRLMAEHFS